MASNRSRVLLAGGAGFIGQAVCDLMDGQAQIYDVASDPACDVFDPSRLEKAVARSDVDVVVHLIGEQDTALCEKDPHRSFNLNLTSLQAVLDACRQAGGKKVVFLSSAAIYGVPDNLPIPETAPLRGTGTYATHKRLGEEMVRLYHRQHGVQFVILRLFNVYGRGVRGIFSRALPAAKRGEPIPVFGVGQYRDFVYVNDVAQAIAWASQGDRVTNMTVNIGSGQGTQIRELMGMINGLYPKAVWQVTDSPMPLYDIIADISKARLLLTFTPHTSRDFMLRVMKEEICPYL